MVDFFFSLHYLLVAVLGSIHLLDAILGTHNFDTQRLWRDDNSKSLPQYGRLIWSYCPSKRFIHTHSSSHVCVCEFLGDPYFLRSLKDI